MNQVMEWLADGCALTLTAAVAALPLALVALGLDAALGRCMSARVRCAMWTLVAVRLLLPLAPGSPLSFQNAWRLVESPRTVSVVREVAAAPARPAESVAAPRDLILESGVAEGAAIVAGTDAVDWEAVIGVAIVVAWFTGVVVVLTRAGVASARFARRLRSVPCTDDLSLIRLMETVCRDLGVRRIPRVKYVAELPAPALFGVLRPTVCLPVESQGELSDAQLRLILLHEVMHIRRFDGVQAWLLTVVRAVHWFNPVAWLAVGRVALYREEACDEAVRRFTHSGERSLYTELLLRFASDRSVGRVGFVGLCFARPARHLAARIRAFAQEATARRTLPRAAVVVGLAIVAIAGLTDAVSSTPEQPQPQTVAEWMAQPRDGSMPEKVRKQVQGLADEDSTEEPLEERIYDLAPALAKLVEINPDVNSREWLMSYLKLPNLQPSVASEVDGAPHSLRVVMTPRGHEALAGLLASIGRTGPWQVVIRTRLIRGLRLEAIGDIDWEDAVKFVRPEAHAQAGWPDDKAGDSALQRDAMALSVESVSWNYSPYLAFVVDKKRAAEIVDRQQGDRRASIMQVPQITLFSGQHAKIRDEAIVPFVVGVHYIKGERATAAQPDIAVLSEGSRLDVEPVVIDAGAVDLKCRLTLSAVERVGLTKLPGQERTVQNPRVTRTTISVRRQLAPGETLFIAPLPEEGASDKDSAECFAVSAEWFPDTYVAE